MNALELADLIAQLIPNAQSSAADDRARTSNAIADKKALGIVS